MRIAAFTLVPPLALLVAGPAPAHAQANSGPEHIAALRQCGQLAEASAKLACLERASGALVGAADRGDIRLVDRAEREQARRGLFGFNIGNLFGGAGDKEEGREELAEMATLVSTITQVRQLDRRTYQFRIAEANALWQINEAPSRFIAPRIGDKVEFKRAALGSYFVRVSNQIGVKGKRIG